jgi:hypothetical protein
MIIWRVHHSCCRTCHQVSKGYHSENRKDLSRTEVWVSGSILALVVEWAEAEEEGEAERPGDIVHRLA